MSRLKDPKIDKATYTDEELRGLVAYCSDFVAVTNQLLNEVSARSPCWPSYVWEEVSPYEISPPHALAQDLYDLSTAIGNINLRLQALKYALDGPVIK